MPNPLFKTIGESRDKPPVPPPRYKRKTPKEISQGVLSEARNSADVLEEVAQDLIRMGDEIQYTSSSGLSGGQANHGINENVDLSNKLAASEMQHKAKSDYLKGKPKI